MCHQWLFENMRSDKHLHFLMKGLEEVFWREGREGREGREREGGESWD